MGAEPDTVERPSDTATPEELLAHTSFVQRLARELVGDAQSAADLAQDTLVVALEHPPRRTGSLRGWLATVAANLSRNARRSDHRRGEREQRVARAEAVDGDVLSLDRIELQRALLDLLLTLPAAQRTVLYLRFYEGLAPGAIAERLGEPLQTVKTRQARALAGLREKLDARSRGDRRAWLEALIPLALPRAVDFGGASLGTVIGGLLMKKLAVAGLIAALALFAWWAVGRGDLGSRAHPDSDEAKAYLADVQADPPERLPALSAAEPLAQREAVAAIDSTPKGALDVRLSWSDGTPAAEVGLVVRCAADPAPRAEFLRTTTDAQGVAHFGELHAGEVKLRPDLRDPFAATVVAGVTSTVAHTLSAGLEVSGHVLGPDGAPAGFASIWCDGEEHGNPQMRRAAPCAADGTFRLRDVRRRALFGARAPGFRPSPCVTAESLTVGTDGARTVELRLGPSGGRVRGRVLDPDGVPLVNARVLAGPRGGHNVNLPSGITARAPSPAAVETGADGTFELVDDLDPGTQPIHATARGFPVWNGEVDVAFGADSTIEIRLERPTRIDGRVLDFDGRPIANVTVLAAKEIRGGWYFHDFPPVQCRSGADGRFVLDWIAPGVSELNAHDDLRPEIGRARGTVECSAGTTTTCELRLARGNVISGRVQDSDGAPIANWGVYASTTMNQTYPRQTKSARDGTFTILNLGEGAFDLSVRDPDLGPPRARLPNIPVGSVDVVLEVADAHVRAGTLRGRMVDPSQGSLADVVITLWRDDGREGHFVDADDRTGIFEHRTQPGRYRLSFQRGGRDLLTTPIFVLEEDQTLDLGDIRFPAPARVELTLKPEAANLLAGLGLSPEDLSLSLDAEAPIASDTLSLKNQVWISQDLQPGPRSITLSSRQVRSRRGDADYDREVQLLAQIRRIGMRCAELEVRAGETTHFALALERTVEVPIVLDGVDPQDITIEARGADGLLLARWRMGYDSSDAAQRVSFPIHLPLGRAVIEVRSGEDKSGRAEVLADEEARERPPTNIVLRKTP